MLKFAKIRDVKTPHRGTTLSAGIDFFVPEYSESYANELKEKNPGIVISSLCDNPNCKDLGDIIIPQHGSLLVPAGIKSKFDEDYMLIAINKSGIASKKGLVIGACLIDADYAGEIHINVINTTSHTVSLNFGQKLTQFVLMPVNLAMPEIIDEDELMKLHEASERGEGGFGSTGV
jgi:dUTP pyrophosphatase